MQNPRMVQIRTRAHTYTHVALGVPGKTHVQDGGGVVVVEENLSHLPPDLRGLDGPQRAGARARLHDHSLRARRHVHTPPSQ